MLFNKTKLFLYTVSSLVFISLASASWADNLAIENSDSSSESKKNDYVWLKNKNTQNSHIIPDHMQVDRPQDVGFVGMAPIIEEKDKDIETRSTNHNQASSLNDQIEPAAQENIVLDDQLETPLLSSNETVETASDIQPTASLPVDTSLSVPLSSNEFATQYFEEALARTYITNPILAAQRENIRLSYENIINAKTGWLPTLSGSGNIDARFQDSDQRGSDGDTLRAAGATLSQPLFRGGRTTNRVSQRELEAQATYNNYLNNTQIVLFNFISSYVDVVTAMSEIEVNEQNVTRLQTQYEATQNEFDVGLLTLTDVSQSRARLAEAEAGLIQAKGLLEQRLAAYTEVTGERPNLDSFTMPDKILSPMILQTLPSTLDLAERISITSNPEWLASELSLQALDYSVQAAKSELLPELSMAGSVRHQSTDGLNASGDDVTDANIGLELTVPIFNAGVTQSNIRQAKINKFSEKHTHEALKRRIIQDTQSAWQNFRTAQSVFDAAIIRLEASQTARDGVYNEREVGSRTVLDTLDAEQELLNAQLQLITAERDLLIGQITVLQAVGLLSTDLFGLDDVLDRYNLKTLPSLSIGGVFETSVQPMDK